jgi:hypothetical protein
MTTQSNPHPASDGSVGVPRIRAVPEWASAAARCMMPEVFSPWASRATGLCLAMVLALVVVGSCETQGAADCHDEPVPRSALPVPTGFSLRRTWNVAPEACGSGSKRLGVLTGAAGSADDLLAEYMAALTANGWTITACRGPSERCVRHATRHLFLAATTPNPAPAPGFPAPVGTGPQVLVVVQSS